MAPNSASGTSGDVAWRVRGNVLRCDMPAGKHGRARPVNTFV
jgi:hypothetical protein